MPGRWWRPNTTPSLCPIAALATTYTLNKTPILRKIQTSSARLVQTVSGDSKNCSVSPLFRSPFFAVLRSLRCPYRALLAVATTSTSPQLGRFDHCKRRARISVHASSRAYCREWANGTGPGSLRLRTVIHVDSFYDNDRNFGDNGRRPLTYSGISYGRRQQEHHGHSGAPDDHRLTPRWFRSDEDLGKEQGDEPYDAYGVDDPGPVRTYTQTDCAISTFSSSFGAEHVLVAEFWSPHDLAHKRKRVRNRLKRCRVGDL